MSLKFQRNGNCLEFVSHLRYVRVDSLCVHDAKHWWELIFGGNLMIWLIWVQMRWKRNGKVPMHFLLCIFKELCGFWEGSWMTLIFPPQMIIYRSIFKNALKNSIDSENNFILFVSCNFNNLFEFVKFRLLKIKI